MIIFDKQNLNIVSSSNCDFCLSCRKCHKERSDSYYLDASNDNLFSIRECPYGYCSIVGTNKIYSGLKIKGFYKSKKTDTKTRSHEKSTIFEKDEIIQIVEEFEKLEKESLNQNVYSSTIHDIKRATSCFSELLEEVIEEGEYKNDKRLRDLIDGLDLIRTRLDYHDFILNKSPSLAKSCNKINLVDIGVKISKMLRYKSDMREIKISNSNNANRPLYIMNDSKSIFVLFFILVENAIKYSPNHTTIYIDYNLSENSPIVEFKNYIKEPLSDDDLRNIFLKGYRGSNSSNIDGNGQGMAIVKSICDDIGCEYSAKNSEDKLRFVFELRFKR